jgi:hypothetical protein
VGTSVTVKAKAFRADGSISDLSSAAYTFNYGTLSTPVASPGAGPFQTAPQVTLSADTASTIHYTLDGSDPTASSTLYSGAISIASGGQTLKARAFEQDWTASAALTAAYAIDNADPTIVADVFPALQNGWMSTPVTVSFRCNDASGIASCSSPTTFSSEGANQTVTGTAVDLAGNDVSIVVTVSLDLAPPVVTLTSPADRTVTSATTIQLTGAVSDALSGVVSAKCNGVTATIDNGAVTCTVVLHPGRNAVVLQASDAAGHSSSTGVTVTRVGTASHVMLSPATRTLLVDESTTLSLLDDFGVAVFGATWTSSDTDILTLSNDDPPVLTAIADGEATLTATKNGLTSEATITVVTGTTLVDGTTHWTVAPIPNVIMGSPIYTNRVDLSVPDMFTVETDATTGAITMRAVGADGIAQWSMEAPGIPLMGDSFGGVIGGELYDPEIDFDYRALIRFGGPTTAAPWRYESAGSVARPAQGPDGTIYAIEFLDGGLGPQGNRIWDKHAVVLNGSNGQLIARVPLAREEWRWDAVREGQLQFITSGQPCASNVRQYVPPTVGPIVNADGQGYFIVRQRTRIGHVDCLENYPAHGAGESDVNLILLRLSPDGVATTNVINAQHCTDVLSQGNSCDVPPTPDQLVPHGLGGMLATATYTTVIFSSNQFYEEKRLTRLDGIGGKVEHVIGQYDRIAMIGDVGTVFLQNVSGIEAVDGLTLASKFTASDVVPVMAQIGGGLAAQAAVGDSMTFFSDNGTVLGQVNMPLVTPNPEVSVGSLTGLTNGSIGMIEASQVDPIVGEFNVLTHGSRSGQDSQYQSLPTIQAAAVARLRSYNFRSIRVNVEFGGSICRTPQNRFIGTYSRPVERATGSDDVDPTTCSSLFAIPELPLAGRYHTHGRDGNVGLSWGDVGHAHDNPTIPWFVASPCGGIYEYSGFTSPRPWYTWLPRAIDLDAIYGKPLPERTTTPLQNPCPVDIGIIYPPPQ